jgi:zinc/manganese transport system substrate-binding protein/manganese/iron transport system substrate-binding protein
VHGRARGSTQWSRGWSRVALVAAVGAVVTLAACGSDPSSGGPTADDGGPVSVVATTTQLRDFASVIGGRHVRVYGVLKANVDPHDFEPSPADIDALARADVIVKNGVGLERWFDDVIASADPNGEIVDASTGVRIRNGDGDEEDGTGDPHIWHNPRNAMRMVSTLEKALERADPAHTGDYRQNLRAYVAELESLDADIQQRIDRLSNKKLVTNHDALGYYVDRYGLEYVGSIIPSFDSSAELSARDVTDIVARIEATGVRAVFSESSLPAKTAEAIGREAGVRVVAGEDALYGDTLGPSGTDGDTYLRMEAHNTKVIVDNLGAPGAR